MSINDLNLRDEVTDEQPSELPEQMGGGASLPTLLPGISLLRIPNDIAQCIEAFDVEDKAADKTVIMRPATAVELATNPSATMVPKTTQRLRLKFDKDTPLVVVGKSADDPQNGSPVATSISNVPRNRAKKGDPPALVADAAYLLRTSLGLNTQQYPLTKPKEWFAAFLAIAGKVFRCEHGLTAQCRADKVRYINNASDESGRGSIEDPTGQKGCGQRYYTKDFRLPDGKFSDIVYCKNPACRAATGQPAKLRGFFQIERFLEPTAGQN